MAKKAPSVSYKMDKNTQKVVSIFQKINMIPRGSGNEEGIRQYLVAWANEKKLDNEVDGIGNVIIRVPATKGMENRPTIVLQGHMDMVCEKRENKKHDFLKDPIKTIIDGEWLRADGTTLGADDGIALALAMALVEDPSVKHPKLEFLFTIDEERGLTGANGLGHGVLKGKYLINLDSEDEGIFTVGCAGGCDTNMTLDLQYEEVPSNYVSVELVVDKCMGGHSGTAIHEERANAIRLMARLLSKIRDVSDLRLIDFNGGTAHNAIPRSAIAKFFIPAADLNKVKNMMVELSAVIIKEFSETDPEMQISFNDNYKPNDRRSMLPWLSVKVIDFVRAIPHGVASRIKKLNMTETSNNLAIVKVENGQLLVRTSQRSSVISRRDAITSRVEAVGRLAGAHVWSGNGYVPWEPNFESSLLKQCQGIYEKLFKAEPKVITIHAGLECGIIGDKHPGMEMISIGPDAVDIHTPDEKLYLPSVSRIYELVAAFLGNLK